MKNKIFNPHYIILLALLFSACDGKTFDVELRAVNKKGDGNPISEGTVQLKFGTAAALPEQALDAQGKAFFKNIPERFHKDSLQVVYHPANNKVFRILEQYPAVVETPNVVHVTIDFPPEFTSFEWSLRDKEGNGIEGAQVTINERYHLETGSNGYFNAAVQQYAGTKAHFKIEKNGKVLLDRDVVVYPEYQRLIID